ncbi:MAG: hypothetical protein NTU49_08745 [Gammaproteobacteria bacterium]|nr:hypothetical protein [Gammaproteobacteria bacterium]
MLNKVFCIPEGVGGGGGGAGFAGVKVTGADATPDKLDGSLAVTVTVYGVPIVTPLITADVAVVGEAGVMVMRPRPYNSRQRRD